jgi:hypothetical protein
MKLTYWGHSSIDTTGDYYNVLKLDKKTHSVLMTVLCDHGAQLGIMATNITDNFAREVKPQQLRHFFNLHTCNLDNIDLFYQDYYKNVFMQQPINFLQLNTGMYSPESIGKKRDWIQKWTKAEHRTFAERFVAFTAATLIFDTVNFCAVDTFENIGILRGLVEATSLMKKHNKVLEDFANFIHNELLIHAASPLSIREIMCDAAEYKLEYAVAITPEDDNSFLDRSVLFKHIKKNADKTLSYLVQPPYFHEPTM